MTKKQFAWVYKTTVLLMGHRRGGPSGSHGALGHRSSGSEETFLVIFLEPLKSFYITTEVLITPYSPCAYSPWNRRCLPAAVSLNIGAEGQMLMGILGATIIATQMPGLPRFANHSPLYAGGDCFRRSLRIHSRFSEGKARSQRAPLNGYAQLYCRTDLHPLSPGAAYRPRGACDRFGNTPVHPLSKAGLADPAWSPGTRLHTGILVALALAVIIYFFLWRTSWGYKMRAAGAEAKAARYGGINVSAYLIIAMVISGAFAGLAGSVEVLGLHRRAIEGISMGYGFTGIVVALFGGLHPAGIVPSAFLFGLILVGGDMTQRMVGVPVNMVQVLQGIIILTIVSVKMVINNPYIMERAERRFQQIGS